MTWLLLAGAVLCAVVATILGFQWFGTDGENWQGWISAALLLYFLWHLVGVAPGLKRPEA